MSRLSGAFLFIFSSCLGCVITQSPAPGALVVGDLRVWRVADGIYRSAQPTKRQFQELSTALAIKSSIKLDTELESWENAPSGVFVFQHDWLPAGPVSDNQIEEALSDLEIAPRPVLVHCLHGEDRTGLLVGLYRVRHGATPAMAWAEMRAYGFHGSLVMLRRAFERQTGWRVP